MNILTDCLPTEVEIDEKNYLINYDFRTCLKVIMAFEDAELSNFEKQSVCLGNMYPVVPDNTEKAIELAVKFLDGGIEKSTGEGEIQQRLFSWSKDANFIFAAFKQTHNIDLEKETDLHWWKFIALYMDLGSDTVFNNLTSLRKRVFSGKATDEEYKVARELGDLFELDQSDPRTPEQIEMDEIFDRALEGGD